MIFSLIFSLILFQLFHTEGKEGIVGVDLGAANVVTGMIGGKLNFELIQSETGKRKIPSVVTFDKIRRYCGNQAYEKV